ncbi:hypothetical protein SAMN04487818_106345 [Actinokineospora terrae]|uniref:Uncharacterized protein n=1 Tax=Actinokineospora terrae TaxID=155974 RepID=A0A1H9TL52_9PSEU|nr:hypothetical protein SAMN04487818_106345 [Actinokineospora terrae]
MPPRRSATTGPGSPRTQVTRPRRTSAHTRPADPDHDTTRPPESPTPTRAVGSGHDTSRSALGAAMARTREGDRLGPRNGLIDSQAISTRAVGHRRPEPPVESADVSGSRPHRLVRTRAVRARVPVATGWRMSFRAAHGEPSGARADVVQVVLSGLLIWDGLSRDVRPVGQLPCGHPAGDETEGGDRAPRGKRGGDVPRGEDAEGGLESRKLPWGAAVRAERIESVASVMRGSAAKSCAAGSAADWVCQRTMDAGVVENRVAGVRAA